MNWSNCIRQVHRWTSVVFAVIVASIFATLGLGKQPAEWVYFLPLFPLAILLATGLYMFALPYLGGRRTIG
ncbi:hypothetical protein [Ensifer sp.]|uniref:hypothetical protein n=1 Tax=Ensifer sp. TaxID=1872086 RepID=UPI000DD9AC58|nr:hypothetical protein [Ensifer sp.]